MMSISVRTVFSVKVWSTTGATISLHAPPVAGLPEFSLSQKLRQDLASIDPTMLLVIQLKTMSDDYERGLAVLESLISGKKRQDGSKWEHAFDMMHDYLEVCDYSSLFWHDIASE